MSLSILGCSIEAIDHGTLSLKVVGFFSLQRLFRLETVLRLKSPRLFQLLLLLFLFIFNRVKHRKNFRFEGLVVLLLFVSLVLLLPFDLQNVLEK